MELDPKLKLLNEKTESESELVPYIGVGPSPDLCIK